MKRSKTITIKPLVLQFWAMLRSRSLISLLCLVVMAHAPQVLAQYSSGGYSTNEVLFGTGGDVDISSPNYRAQASAGSTGGGDFYSANYRSNVGFLTQNEVFLEESVSSTAVNLGNLSTLTTGSGSATFTVRTYLSEAYSVVTMSQPLTNEDGYQMATPNSPTTSTTGTEQFGINLVKNTNFCGSGCDLGDDPVNQPDNSFADGRAASGYDTPNQFKYGVGDIIAFSPKTVGNQAIGLTTYTVSYIANQAPLTRAGLYTMNHDIVVVGTF